MLMTPDNGKAKQIAQALRAVLPEDVAVVARAIAADAPPLYPQETACLENAVPKRMREFAAGRAAARMAMAVLKQPTTAIPMGADRTPVWPAGIIGSISHTDTICAAALAMDTDHRSIGIDLEPDAHLPPDVLDAVCAARERAWLATLPVPQQGRAARILFSAKEAFFKAQYPLTQSMIGFDAVTIEAGWTCGTFTATPRQTIGDLAGGKPMRGKWTHAAGHLACAVVIGHSD